MDQKLRFEIEIAFRKFPLDSNAIFQDIELRIDVTLSRGIFRWFLCQPAYFYKLSSKIVRIIW